MTKPQLKLQYRVLPLFYFIGSCIIYVCVSNFTEQTTSALTKWTIPVSYTHLDVYKRQEEGNPIECINERKYSLEMKKCKNGNN